MIVTLEQLYDSLPAEFKERFFSFYGLGHYTLELDEQFREIFYIYINFEQILTTTDNILGIFIRDYAFDDLDTFYALGGSLVDFLVVAVHQLLYEVFSLVEEPLLGIYLLGIYVQLVEGLIELDLFQKYGEITDVFQELYYRIFGEFPLLRVDQCQKFTYPLSIFEILDDISINLEIDLLVLRLREIVDEALLTYDELNETGNPLDIVIDPIQESIETGSLDPLLDQVDNIEDATTDLTNVTEEIAVDAVEDFVDNAAEEVVDVVTIDLVEDAVDSVTDSVDVIGDELLDNAEPLLDTTTDEATDVVGGILEEDEEEITDSVENVLDVTGETLVEEVDDVLTETGELLGEVGDILSGEDPNLDTGQIEDGFADLGTILIEGSETADDSVEDFLLENGASTDDTLDNSQNTIEDGLVDTGETLVSAFTEINEAIDQASTDTQEVIDNVSSGAEDSSEVIESGTEEVTEETNNLGEDIVTGTIGTVDDLINPFGF